MLSDRKTAFWVVTWMAVMLFVVMILLAVYMTPTGLDKNLPPENTLDDNELLLINEIKNLRQMVWWTTIAMVMLPIIMLLMMLAIYLFLTANPAQAVSTYSSASQRGLFGKTKASRTLVDDTSVLDERYARGEITREQYLSMKADLAYRK